MEKDTTTTIKPEKDTKEESTTTNTENSTEPNKDNGNKDEAESLKTRLAELEEANKQLNEVATFVAYDDELRESFKKKYQAKLSGDTSKEKEVEENMDNKDNEYTKLNSKVETLERRDRSEIVKDFENKLGLDNMKPEERSKFRQNIEATLKRWGHSAQTSSVENLPDLLEDAYRVSYADDLAKNKELEGAAKARNNAYGAFSARGSFGAPTEDDGLNSNQLDLVKALGVDPKKAEKYYRERETEETRVPDSEKK